MSGFPADPVEPPRIAGVVVGIVSKVEGDPDNLGRVQLTLPTLGIASNWARVASFFTGEDYGGFFAPAEGDEVLVAFEMGDVTRPFVVGRLWNGVDRAPVPAEEAQGQKMIKTAKGLTLIFTDDPEPVQILLSDGQGNQLWINATEKSVELTAKGDMTISAEGKVAISGAEVTVSATGKLALKGDGEASLASDGEASVQAPLVKLN